MDTGQEIYHFSKRIAPLSEAVGLQFSWHFVDSDLLRQVPPEQRQCFAPFCLRTRGRLRFTLDRCLRDHREIAFRKALLVRGPFTLVCHAGAKLLAVPLFLGDLFLGVLFAGPVVGPSEAVYPEMAGEYRKLPVRGEKELLALGRYLGSEFALQAGGARPQETKDPLTPQLTTTDRRILRAAHLMRRDRRGKVSAVRIAAECGVGLSTLLHIFRRETGFTFRDWLQRLRVSDAQSLIEGSDLTFNEIALTCGFSDQSRMTVLTKRYLDRTPRELRRAAVRQVAPNQSSGQNSGRGGSSMPASAAR